jgi:hypothetical protein
LVSIYDVLTLYAIFTKSFNAVKMDRFKNHPLNRRYNIDSAISYLLDFYKKKFLPLFLMSFAMSLVMEILSTSLDYTKLQNTTDIQVMVDSMKEMIWPIVTIMILSLLFNLIMNYYVLYNPLHPEINVFKSILHSMKYFLPYMGVVIFLIAAGSLIIGLGLMVFIVGVIFSVILLVTVYLFIAPVMLIEETDISQTIRRSIKLSYKNFWANIGWVTVLIVIVLIISIGMSAIVLLPFTGSFIKTLANPEDATNMIELARNPVYLILSALAGAITLPIMPIFSYILYFNSIASLEEEITPKRSDDDDGRIRVEDLYAKPYYDDTQSNQNKDDNNGKVRVEDLYAKPYYDDKQSHESGIDDK